MILDFNFQNLAKSTFWQQNRTVDLLVSLIHSNSITQLMPNPFQIDCDMQTDIPKTKIPISSKTSIKLTISKHHNFRIKQCKILLTSPSATFVSCGPAPAAPRRLVNPPQTRLFFDLKVRAIRSCRTDASSAWINSRSSRASLSGWSKPFS